MPLSVTELWINSTTKTINVYTNNKNKIGDHFVDMTVTLVRGYSPPVTKTFQFKVTIDPCIVTSLTMQDLSPKYDKTYFLADSPLKWDIVADTTAPTTVLKQTPACGYIQEIQAVSTSFLSVTAGPTMKLQLETRDKMDAQEWPISVTATLTDYPS